MRRWPPEGLVALRSRPPSAAARRSGAQSPTAFGGSRNHWGTAGGSQPQAQTVEGLLSQVHALRAGRLSRAKKSTALIDKQHMQPARLPARQPASPCARSSPRHPSASPRSTTGWAGVSYSDSKRSAVSPAASTRGMPSRSGRKPERSTWPRYQRLQAGKAERELCEPPGPAGAATELGGEFGLDSVRPSRRRSVSRAVHDQRS